MNRAFNKMIHWTKTDEELYTYISEWAQKHSSDVTDYRLIDLIYHTYKDHPRVARCAFQYMATDRLNGSPRSFLMDLAQMSFANEGYKPLAHYIEAFENNDETIIGTGWRCSIQTNLRMLNLLPHKVSNHRTSLVDQFVLMIEDFPESKRLPLLAVFSNYLEERHPENAHLYTEKLAHDPKELAWQKMLYATCNFREKIHNTFLLNSFTHFFSLKETMDILHNLSLSRDTAEPIEQFVNELKKGNFTQPREHFQSHLHMLYDIFPDEIIPEEYCAYLGNIRDHWRFNGNKQLKEDAVAWVERSVLHWTLTNAVEETGEKRVAVGRKM